MDKKGERMDPRRALAWLGIVLLLVSALIYAVHLDRQQEQLNTKEYNCLPQDIVATFQNMTSATLKKYIGQDLCLEAKVEDISEANGYYEAIFTNESYKLLIKTKMPYQAEEYRSGDTVLIKGEIKDILRIHLTIVESKSGVSVCLNRFKVFVDLSKVAMTRI